MTTPSEPPTTVRRCTASPFNGKKRMQPKVFLHSTPLQEQLRGTSRAEVSALALTTLRRGISKKYTELWSELHTQRYTPMKRNPFTVQEASAILKQADRLLASIPNEGAVKMSPAAHTEKIRQAYDIFLQLDAAIRALQVP